VTLGDVVKERRVRLLDVRGLELRDRLAVLVDLEESAPAFEVRARLRCVRQDQPGQQAENDPPEQSLPPRPSHRR
jgi:hypothetical protein